MNPKERINYVEFPAKDLEATKSFFSTVFAWTFQDYGPEYSAFGRSDAGLDGGFYKAESFSSTLNGAALVVFYSEDLESLQARIEEAGGAIVRATFAFPGGRRFHFTEPSGNEFAAWSDQ